MWGEKIRPEVCFVCYALSVHRTKFQDPTLKIEPRWGGLAIEPGEIRNIISQAILAAQLQELESGILCEASLGHNQPRKWVSSASSIFFTGFTAIWYGNDNFARERTNLFKG